MKRQGRMLIAVLGAVCLMAQPALAAGVNDGAEGTVLEKQDWVNVGQGENGTVWLLDSQNAVPATAPEEGSRAMQRTAGQESGGEAVSEVTVQEAGGEGSQGTAGQESGGEAVPEATVQEGGGEAPQEASGQAADSEAVQGAAPEQSGSGDTSQAAAPGQESGQTSVVILAGQNNEQQSGGPAFQAAEEEARRAAEEEAARQAAEAEAARQAEEAARQAEEAARQAAEEAARQAAEEAARQAAARQASGRVIDPSKPMVALTYDDGPQPSVGNRIMDCMAQYGGKATFFMVGERVGSYAAEVQRMVAEGHEVANHSMNHKYFQKLGAAEIQAQVNRCNDAIEAACGVRPRVMRLPGGNYNATVLASTNMPMIQWNIDTKDWKTKNAQQTIQVVLSQVKDGDIILMHELYGATGDASMQIIPELTKRGYQLVTVSEMAAAKGRALEPGKLYSSFR